MKVWLVVTIFLVIFILFSTKDQVTTREPVGLSSRESQGPRGPRKYPVYTDDPKMYLDKPILYSEWNQKLN